MNRLSIRLLCRKCLAVSGQLILFWLLAGCEKNPIPLTTDSAIKGTASADSSGKETYHIKIKAVGPYGETPVITEKKDYRIEGLGNGTYYLEYSKDGYGTVCQYGFQLFGGDVVRAPDVTLYQLSKITTIPNFIRAYTADATSPPSPYIYIYIDLAITNIKPADLSVMLFMSSSSRDVSWDNYEFCYPTYKGGTKNNIPYGKYNLQSKKEKYAQLYGGISVFHVGGYSPTYADLWIFGVPTFEIYIDSIGYVKKEHYLYFRLRPDTIYRQTSFRAFAANNRNVSKDNYVSAGKGYLAIWYPSYPTVVPTYGRMDTYDFDQNIEKLKNDTIFLRIYPIASQQGYDIMQFSPESVGKPSNVIKFLWSHLVQ